LPGAARIAGSNLPFANMVKEFRAARGDIAKSFERHSLQLSTSSAMKSRHAGCF
jgi:hypothetical protein